MAENKAVLPASKLHPAESNDVEERPLPFDPLPITKTVAVVETKRFDSLPAAQRSVTEQASQMPALGAVQEQQGSLINKTLSMVAVAISKSTAPEAPHLLHSLVTHQDIVSKEVKEDKAVSLIAEVLSMVPQSLHQLTRPPSEGRRKGAARKDFHRKNDWQCNGPTCGKGWRCSRRTKNALSESEKNTTRQPWQRSEL